MSTTGKQIVSTLADGKLTVEVAQTEIAEPTGNQVLVRMEAAPINPSDLAILTGMADLENAEYSPGKFVADMPEPFNSAQKARHGQRLPAGNEGAGTVVAAGENEFAQSLVGQSVACVPGNAYAEYCLADAGMCLPLGDISAVDGASAFVNPMTALGFVETARMEGEGAIIHTAAASNLGQMLVRICQEDEIPLVNIVRRQEHVDLLRSEGAEHVVDSLIEVREGALQSPQRSLLRGTSQRLAPTRRVEPMAGGAQLVEQRRVLVGEPVLEEPLLPLEPAAHVVGYRPLEQRHEIRFGHIDQVYVISKSHAGNQFAGLHLVFESDIPEGGVDDFEKQSE